MRPPGGRKPVGESRNQLFQLLFYRGLSVEFQCSRVTSDGGLTPVGKLDERRTVLFERADRGALGGFAHGMLKARPDGTPKEAMAI